MFQYSPAALHKLSPRIQPASHPSPKPGEALRGAGGRAIHAGGMPTSWKEGDKFGGKSLQINKAVLLGCAAGAWARWELRCAGFAWQQSISIAD